VVCITKNGKETLKLLIEFPHFLDRVLFDKGLHVMVDHLAKFVEIKGLKEKVSAGVTPSWHARLRLSGES